MMDLFSYWPFLFSLFIFVFAIRVLPKLFRNYFRHIENGRGYRSNSRTRLRNRFSGSAGGIGADNRRSKDVEVQIFNLAYRLKGKITLSDVIIETGLGIKKAEKVLNRMVDGIRVVMEIDDSGLVIYEFPEIIARFQDDSGL